VGLQPKKKKKKSTTKRKEKTEEMRNQLFHRIQPKRWLEGEEKESTEREEKEICR